MVSPLTGWKMPLAQSLVSEMWRDGSVDQVQIHLVGDLLETAAHDGQGDGIDGH